MARCDTCALMSREYDGLCRDHDDIRVDGDTADRHYCPMYDDCIPAEIYNGEEDCKFYDPAEE